MDLFCLSCGNRRMEKIRRYRTNSKHGRALFGELWLHECSNCGLVQAMPHPAPEELGAYYEADYRTGGFAGSDVADVSKFPKDNLYYYNRGQSIAELVCTYLQKDNPRIVDVGAGYGHVLHALGERYPQADRTAIELSDPCVQHLRSLDVSVYTQLAEEVLPEMEGEFDLIVLSHVLEHLLDPWAMLKLFHQSLAPGGILYIEVPNIPRDALQRYPDNVWAPRFDEPHITFFSQPTLQYSLENADFDVLFCNTAGAEYKYISALAFHMPHWRWFLQKLLPPPVFHFLRKQNVTKSMRVKEREESFYQYGGVRIWIRSISRKPITS